jgi:hypothetical protein
MNEYSALVATAATIGPEESLASLVWDEGGNPQEFLQFNSALLISARRMLSRDCRIPIRFEPDFLPESLEDLGRLRSLARALTIQLRHTHAVGDWAEAVSVGLDILRLANISRGGLIAHLLVGVVFESTALKGLSAMRRRLSPALCETTISLLKQLEDEREPYDAVDRRDRKWEETVGWKESPIDIEADIKALERSESGERGASDMQRAMVEFIEHLAALPDSDRRDMNSALDRRNLAMLRLLRTDLSLRHWHALKGECPSELTLADLIDPTSEVDPFTSKAFVYRRDTPHLFTLYSPGPTRIDNGGVFGPWLSVWSGQADLCLDISDYEE